MFHWINYRHNFYLEVIVLYNSKVDFKGISKFCTRIEPRTIS